MRAAAGAWAGRAAAATQTVRPTADCTVGCTAAFPGELVHHGAAAGPKWIPGFHLPHRPGQHRATSSSEVLAKCFKAAAAKLLLGRRIDFQVCVETHGGKWIPGFHLPHRPRRARPPRRPGFRGGGGGPGEGAAAAGRGFAHRLQTRPFGARPGPGPPAPHGVPVPHAPPRPALAATASAAGSQAICAGPRRDAAKVQVEVGRARPWASHSRTSTPRIDLRTVACRGRASTSARPRAGTRALGDLCRAPRSRRGLDGEAVDVGIASTRRPFHWR